MGVFRHNLPPDACPLGGIAEVIGSTPTAYDLTTGIALDPIRQVYLAFAQGSGLAYGTYDADGQISAPSLVTMSSVDFDSGGSIVVDYKRQIWFLAQQGQPGDAASAIQYGNYNANGEPVKVGSMTINGFVNGAAQFMTIDPINCLWWVGDDGAQSGGAQQVAYGFYDPDTGTTSQSGTCETPVVVTGVTCAATDGLLWVKNYVTTYDPNTGLPGTWADCGVYVTRYISSVDERRKMIFIPRDVNGPFSAFRYAPDGSLTLIGDTLMPSYARAVAVDPLATLLISPEYNGDLYCGKYC